MKSLLIVGVGRSGSTLLQSICCDALEFKNTNEIFNRSVYDELIQHQISFIQELPYFAPRPYWPDMWKLLMRYSKDCVVKDNLQPEFISYHFDKILSQFNVLYIRRNSDDVIKCHHRRGWVSAHVHRVHQIYDRIFSQLRPGMAILQYDDFIKDESFLNNILKLWYPSCKKCNYITTAFIEKRLEVEAFLASN
jgi:hypothetical protein